MARYASKRADPRELYLQWAMETDFEFIFRETSQRSKGAKQPRRQDDGRRGHTGTASSVGLLIGWKSSEAAALAARAIPKGAVVPKVYLAPHEKLGVPPFWTMTLPTAALPSFLRSIESLAEVIELAAPVTPGSHEVIQNKLPAPSKGNTLIGVLDDGCAFANARFRTTTGTRILWLWNQDIDAIGAPLNGTLPSPNVKFNYGAQWSRADLDAFFPAVGGTQDEAYRHAGLTGLRRSATHGTHVMDLLSGKIPLEDNLWDIVFIQFPQAGIDDPSGIWLKRFAADGLFYILECAGPDVDRIVANISWGPQTGPHDGSYVLEQAMEWFVQSAKLSTKSRDLFITLAAGNSFSARTHASVSYAEGGNFDWILPPDGETPAFIELWWPKPVSPAQALLRVIPPHGPGYDVSNGPATNPDGTWWAKIGHYGSATHAVLVVHPTAAKSGKNGPHGRWRVEIEPTPDGIEADIDIYVARADHNMGARRRAKASYLTDAGLEDQRFGSPAVRYHEAANSVVRRAGTMSGIATGSSPEVAAGYVLNTKEPAPYSSSGPTRGVRTGPNYAMATERSQARIGIRGAGVRTGTRVRLIGTSTAAPQRGRLLAERLKPPPINPDPARTGYGEILPTPDPHDPED